MSSGLIGTLLILGCWSGLAVWGFSDVVRATAHSVRRRYLRARRVRAARALRKGDLR